MSGPGAGNSMASIPTAPLRGGLRTARAAADRRTVRQTVAAQCEAPRGVGREGAIYVGCWDGDLYAVNRDGALKWKFAISWWGAQSSPAVGPDGTIYVGSESSVLYAVNPDGSKKWKFTTGAWSKVQGSPAVSKDGTVYFGS